MLSAPQDTTPLMCPTPNILACAPYSITLTSGKRNWAPPASHKPYNLIHQVGAFGDTNS